MCKGILLVVLFCLDIFFPGHAESRAASGFPRMRLNGTVESKLIVLHGFAENIPLLYDFSP
jgi:hypothetical protein